MSTAAPPLVALHPHTITYSLFLLFRPLFWARFSSAMGISYRIKRQGEKLLIPLPRAPTPVPGSMVDLGGEKRASACCMHGKVSAGPDEVLHGIIRCDCTVYDECGRNLCLI